MSLGNFTWKNQHVQDGPAGDRGRGWSCDFSDRTRTGFYSKMHPVQARKAHASATWYGVWRISSSVWSTAKANLDSTDEGQVRPSVWSNTVPHSAEAGPGKLPPEDLVHF